MQPRLLERSGRRPYRLLEQQRFRAGYDFLLLRCQSGEVDTEVGEWWTGFQDAGEAERQEMLLKDGPPQKRRRRRRKSAVKPDAGAAPSADEGQGS